MADNYTSQDGFSRLNIAKSVSVAAEGAWTGDWELNYLPDVIDLRFSLNTYRRT